MKKVFLGGIFIKQDNDNAILHSLYFTRVDLDLSLDFLQKEYPSTPFVYSSNYAPYNLNPDNSAMIENLKVQALLNHKED